MFSQGRGECLILRIAYLLEKKLEWMTGNDVTSQVDALMYVVLSKAEKHVLYAKVVDTKMYNVINEVSQKPKSL